MNILDIIHAKASLTALCSRFSVDPEKYKNEIDTLLDAVVVIDLLKESNTNLVRKYREARSNDSKRMMEVRRLKNRVKELETINDNLKGKI